MFFSLPRLSDQDRLPMEAHHSLSGKMALLVIIGVVLMAQKVVRMGDGFYKTPNIGSNGARLNLH